MKTRLTVTILGVAIAAAPAAAQTPAPAAETPPAAPAEAAPAEPAPDAPVAEAAPAPEVATVEEAVAPEEPAASVEEEAAPAAAWYDSVLVNGFASVAYSFNAARPAGEANQLRVFDTDDGTINVDVIEVVVQKPAAAPGEAGFRVDLEAGSTIPGATASAGLFRDADGVAGDFDLQQAVVSYVGKVGKGLRLDVGKFVTHMGYELIEGYDGFNDNYSRSFLFGYAIPFTHTGAKVSYPLSDKISGMLMVANGWDVVKDNNDGKTVGAQLIGVFGPATAYLNYVGGPEQMANNSDWRHVLDVSAVFAATDELSLGVNADYGYEKIAGASATWSGAAAYAKYAITPEFSVAARGEVFDDGDGARTGVAQTLLEGTVSPSFKLGSNLVLRGDLRIDRSNEQSFMTDDSTSSHQLTVAVNAIGLL
jgi:hypothetical protein